MNIWLFSVADGRLRQLTHGGGGTSSPSSRPTAVRSLLLVADGGVGVWVVAADGGVPRALTRGLRSAVNPAFSPDGRHIAYMSDEGRRLEVWVMNADGSEARPLTQVGVMGHFLRWTADGAGVVFRCPSGRPRAR